jgi:hypothetical protein
LHIAKVSPVLCNVHRKILAVHHQYIPAGTVYFVELTAPLDFGTELLTPKWLLLSVARCRQAA